MEFLKKIKKDFWGTNIRHVLSAPFIYMMLVPLIFMDIFLEIYHNICFRLYGIPQVKRGQYIKVDRHKLEYLSWLQKLNCTYCGYANGLAAYSVEIAGRTEKYWCGIQHKRSKSFKEQPHQKNFARYGDEKEYKKKYL